MKEESIHAHRREQVEPREKKISRRQKSNGTIVVRLRAIIFMIFHFQFFTISSLSSHTFRIEKSVVEEVSKKQTIWLSV